jgi:nucleotide-binding universal stress UspA family protein
MYGDIVIPVDGSSFSERAIPYAAAITRRASARLHVVLVHTPISLYAADLPGTPISQRWEDQHREAEARYLDELAGRLRDSGIEVIAEGRDGDPAHELVAATKSKADLLVMATHGRAGLERAWLGSVADEVIRHVGVPVLTIRPAEESAPPEDPTFQHLLLATDGSEPAEAAASQAVELARLFDARMTLLTVVSVPAGLSSPYIPHAALIDRETTEERDEQARRYLDELAARLAEDVEVDARVTLGYHPARGILDAIDQLGCDLVALGTHRRTRLARIVLGSVADKIVRASPVPVLVAHAPA